MKDSEYNFTSLTISPSPSPSLPHCCDAATQTGCQQVGLQEREVADTVVAEQQETTLHNAVPILHVHDVEEDEFDEVIDCGSDTYWELESAGGKNVTLFLPSRT